MNLNKREERLRDFFPDLRRNLTEEEIKEMEDIRQSMERRAKIPKSQMREVSQELQDRMQSEAEAGYVEVSEEQKRKWREKWINETEDD